MPPNRLFFCSSVLMDAAMYNLCTNKALISFYSFFLFIFLIHFKKKIDCVQVIKATALVCLELGLLETCCHPKIL